MMRFYEIAGYIPYHWFFYVCLFVSVSIFINFMCTYVYYYNDMTNNNNGIMLQK